MAINVFPFFFLTTAAKKGLSLKLDLADQEKLSNWISDL